MGTLVTTLGLVLLVATCIGADRRSKRRARALCDEADRQIAAVAQKLSSRTRGEPAPARSEREP